jgi:hypothetical protein
MQIKKLYIIGRTGNCKAHISQSGKLQIRKLFMINKSTKRKSINQPNYQKSANFYDTSWQHCKEKESRSVSNSVSHPTPLLFTSLSSSFPFPSPWFSSHPSPLLSPLLLPFTVPARRPNKSRSGISTPTAPKTAPCSPSQNSTWAVCPKLPTLMMDTVGAPCDDTTAVADPYGELQNILLPP